MKTLDTSISSEYVGKWTAVEAIREVLQNYLDAREQFQCKGRVDYRNNKVTIHDMGGGITLKHFALGVSDKGSNANAKGKYGEGMTIGSIALARLGRDVVIRSNGYEYRPILKHSKDWGVETLHLEVTETETPEGTQVVIPCEREELEQAKGYFIEFVRQSDKRFQWLERNRISFPAGRIYINGTVEGWLDNAMFSYHFNTEDLERYGIAKDVIGNRDRNTLNVNKLRTPIRDILGRTSSTEAIELMVQEMAVNGQKCVETEWAPCTYEIEHHNKKALWSKAFRNVYGDNAVLSTGDSQLDAGLQHNGGHVVSLPPTWEAVAKTAGLSAKPIRKVAERVSYGRLTDKQKSHLEKAKFLVSHYYADHGTIELTKDADYLGQYSPFKGIIRLNVDILDDQEQTLNVLLHETCHKVTGHSDCTSEFQRAAFGISAKIMLGTFNQ